MKSDLETQHHKKMKKDSNTQLRSQQTWEGIFESYRLKVRW